MTSPIERLYAFRNTGRYGLYNLGKVQVDEPFDLMGRNDCIGAVLWALGQPRHDKDFPEYDGDINVDSALMDAGLLAGGKGLRKYFTPVEWKDAVAGDILMFPSVRAGELGLTTFPATQRMRVGHTGFIYSRTPGTDDVITLECCAMKPAIRLGPDINFLSHNRRKTYQWNGKTYSSDKWQTRVVRYCGPHAK